MITLFANSYDQADCFGATDCFYDCDLKNGVKTALPNYDPTHKYNLIFGTTSDSLIVQEEDETGEYLQEIVLPIKEIILGAPEK